MDESLLTKIHEAANYLKLDIELPEVATLAVDNCLSEEGIRAVRLQHPDVPDRSSKRVGSDAGNQRLVRADIPRQAKQLTFFIILQARGFCSGAEGNEEIDPFSHLSLYKPFVGLIIYFAIPEGSGKGSSASSEFHVNLP